MVTSSRPTEVVDRCSDCRRFACERPVAKGRFSCEPPRSDSHRSLKGRGRLEPCLSPRCGVLSGCRRRSWSRGTGRVGPARWPRDGLDPQHELAERRAHEPPCRELERVADQDPGTTRTQAWMPAGPTATGDQWLPSIAGPRSSQADPATGRPNVAVIGGNVCRWPFLLRDIGWSAMKAGD